MPTAVITGASRGFGRAVARALAATGWALAVDGRDASELDALAAELRTATVVPVPGDVADPVHRAALAAAVGRWDGLDLLLNNASELGPSPLPALTDHAIPELERIYQVNVLAPLALVQAFAGALAAHGGAVVNVSSDAAAEAYPGWGGYGSSKAALDQLTAVLAVERPDLRVYAFDPGDMRTAMHQRAFPAEDISDRPAPEAVVPALVRLLDDRPPSGRYRAADLLAGVAR